MNEDRLATATHEGGHLIVGNAFHWPLGPVTIVGGGAAGGCAVVVPPAVANAAVACVGELDPFILWPCEVRERVEQEALFAMAGPMAEELFGPDSGRLAPPVTAPGEVMERLPAATPAEREAMAVMVDDPSLPWDEERLAKLSKYAFGKDKRMVTAWQWYLRRVCRDLLFRNETRVRFVAIALAEYGTLGAEALAELLADHHEP